MATEASALQPGVDNTRDAEVQSRLFCNRTRLKLHLLALVLVGLPLHFFLVTYYSLVDIDGQSQTRDFSNFDSPFFCNAMWCSGPERSAQALFVAGTYFPLICALLGGHMYFMHRMRAAFKRYWIDKREGTRRARELRAASVWESREEYDRRVFQEHRQRMVEVVSQPVDRYYRVCCYRDVVRVCCRRSEPPPDTCSDRALYVCCKERLVTGTKLRNRAIALFLIGIPWFILFPISMGTEFNFSFSLTPHERRIWSIMAFVVVPVAVGLALTTWRCCQLHRRGGAGLGTDGFRSVAKHLAEGALQLASSSIGSERKGGDEVEDVERAPAPGLKLHMLTRLGMLLDRRCGCGPKLYRISILFYLSVLLPLTVILPVSINWGYEPIETTSISDRLYFRLVLLVPGAIAVLLWSAFAIYEPRNVLKEKAGDLDWGMEGMRRLALRSGLSEIMAGEFPHFSVGHDLITAGLRPRGNPFMHRGHRIVPRALQRLCFVTVVLPLCIVLPVAIHAPKVWSSFDTEIGVPHGASRLSLVIISLSLPTLTIAYVVGRAVLCALPYPVQAMLPWFATWIMGLGVLPLIAFACMELMVADSDAWTRSLIVASLSSPAIIAASLLALYARHFHSVHRWCSSLRLEEGLQERIALAGLAFVPLPIAMGLMVCVWSAVNVIWWDSVAGDGYSYTYATLCAIFAMSGMVALMWTLGAGLFLDFTTPTNSVFNVKPIIMLLLFGCITVRSISVTASYVPGEGGTDLNEAFFASEFNLAAASICVWLMLLVVRDVRAHLKLRHVYGYHPEEWEMVNPNLSARPWEVGAEGFLIWSQGFLDGSPEKVDEEPWLPAFGLEDRKRILRAALLVAPIPPRALHAIAAALRPHSYVDGHILAQASAPIDTLFLIERGVVVATQELEPRVAQLMDAVEEGATLKLDGPHLVSVGDTSKGLGKLAWQVERFGRGSVLGSAAVFLPSAVHQHQLSAWGGARVLVISISRLRTIMTDPLLLTDMRREATHERKRSSSERALPMQGAAPNAAVGAQMDFLDGGATLVDVPVGMLGLEGAGSVKGGEGERYDDRSDGMAIEIKGGDRDDDVLSEVSD